MDIKMICIYFLCIIGFAIIGKLFIIPIKIITKLILNSIFGIFLLYIINLIGIIWSFHIGLNIATALITGILGIPGVLLLIILKLFMF